MGFEHTAPDVVENGTIADLDPMIDFSNHPGKSKRLLFRFLDQFEEVKSRWRNYHEEGTFLLLAHCARYQKEILAPYTPITADERNRLTLVAALLRCLLMAKQLFDMDGWWSSATLIDSSDVYEIRSEGISDYWGLEPTITVQRHQRSSCRSIQYKTRKYPQGLPATLKKAVTVMQQVMFNRRPQDLPCLIYSLCLLDLIAHALRPSADFMSPVREAGGDIIDILMTLCDLYLFCSNNVHPFSEDFDISTYDALVDSDSIAVDHFHTLNHMWQKAGRIVSAHGQKSIYSLDYCCQASGIIYPQEKPFIHRSITLHMTSFGTSWHKDVCRPQSILINFAPSDVRQELSSVSSS